MARAFDTAINTNDQSLDRVLAAGLPVVLLFLSGEAPADLNQALERLARQNAGELLFARVQVRDNPASARRFGISRTPAVVGIHQGDSLSQTESASANDLIAHANYLLGKGSKPASSTPQPEPQRTSGNGTAAHRTESSAAYDSRPVPVGDATFDQEVLRSPQLVLVDFWAPWCAPCRMVEPIVERLAVELAGKVRFAKVNVDENPALSQRFNVNSIPTMMLVKDGKIVDRWAGALPESAIRGRLGSVLN